MKGVHFAKCTLGLTAVVVGLFCGAAAAAHLEEFQILRVYPLKVGEGVFAYARISPDGNYLAYASETRRTDASDVNQTMTIVNLASRKVLVAEAGIDAYWSADGKRLIYLDQSADAPGVTVRHFPTGAVVRNVAPAILGDYFSWAVRGGADTIMTIRGNFYSLVDDHGVLPARSIKPCPGIGTGERPLISKDGLRVTAFSHGTVIVRDVEDCDNILGN